MLKSKAESFGISTDGPSASALPGPLDLAAVYNDEIEQAVRAAYQKDYVMLGFSDWTPSA